MGQISATFKNSIEGMVKAYADFNGISFSEATEIMAGKSVTEWFQKLPKAKQKEYVSKFEIWGGKK